MDLLHTNSDNNYSTHTFIYIKKYLIIRDRRWPTYSNTAILIKSLKIFY